jgi:ubiquinone/menaquinone biosynthesis C-methylase UbiE
VSAFLNPFSDPDFAAHYEDWYRGPGAVADRLEKRLLAELLVSFPDRRTLLEVGCGTGHFARWFEQQGLATVGVDSSAAMLDEARRLGRGLLVQADACALPFADRTFDLVTLIATLEFLADPARALKEVVRVARHGLLVGTFNRWSVYALRRRLSSSCVWRRARFFGPYQVQRLLLRAAGRRARNVRWRAVSWSLPPREKSLRIPYGDFVGVALELSPNT